MAGVGVVLKAVGAALIVGDGFGVAFGIRVWDCADKNRPAGEYSGYTCFTSRKTAGCFLKRW